MTNALSTLVRKYKQWQCLTWGKCENAHLIPNKDIRERHVLREVLATGIFNTFGEIRSRATVGTLPSGHIQIALLFDFEKKRYPPKTPAGMWTPVTIPEDKWTHVGNHSCIAYHGYGGPTARLQF